MESEPTKESCEEQIPETNISILEYIFRTAYPITIALILEVSGNFISLFFASRTKSLVPGSVIFAGVSLSTMFANVTCFSVHEGMSGAVETIGSQANGAKEYRRVGIVWIRCVVVLTVLTIPLAMTWVYVDDLLYFLGVSADICKVIEVFLLVSICIFDLYLYLTMCFAVSACYVGSHVWFAI